MRSLYMKMALAIILVFGLFALRGCTGGVGSTFTQASGTPNEVMLVMDRDYLQDSAGYAVKNMLRSYVPAMPQIEEQMDVRTVAREDFDSFLRYVRNILIVDIDGGRYTKSSVKYTYDQWAHGQIVVTINSPSADSIRHLMSDRGRAILNLFVRHELSLQAASLVKDFSHQADQLAVQNLGYHLNAPEDITSYKVGVNCLWLSNNATRRRTDMLLYKVPYHGEPLTRPYLVSLRDSVLKANVPGPLEGSHAVTAPHILMTRQIVLIGQPMRTELRGLWELRGGGSMGGPFVEHAFVTPKGDELVVAEAFVYHPNEAKRNIMQQVEAALFSIRPDSVTHWDAGQVAQARWTEYTTY